MPTFLNALDDRKDYFLIRNQIGLKARFWNDAIGHNMLAFLLQIDLPIPYLL